MAVSPCSRQGSWLPASGSQGASRSGISGAPLLGLQTAASSLCPRAAFPLRTHPPGGSCSSYKDPSPIGLGPTFRPHLTLVTPLKAPSTGVITTGFGLRHRLLGQTQSRPELPSKHSPRSWKDLGEQSSRPRRAGRSPGAHSSRLGPDMTGTRMTQTQVHGGGASSAAKGWLSIHHCAGRITAPKDVTS